MKIKNSTLLSLCMIALCVFTTSCNDSTNSSSTESNSDLEVTVTLNPEGGFMNGGWGNINFNFQSTSKSAVSISEITGSWQVDGDKYHEWSVNSDVKVAANGTGSQTVTTWMPDSSEELANAAGSNPYVSGSVVLTDGRRVSYKVEIPVATLSSPLVQKSGNYVGVELQETTWETVNDPEKVAKYLDDTYKHMYELTGRQPYDGDLMIIRECPPNPYFAYAGNPIVLNTLFVEKSVKEIDNDQVCFGWVHEMGHDFDDVIGHWYNYGTFTEFQANIKLSYVIEQMCEKGGDYQIISWVDKTTPLDGVSFNDEYFGPYGDDYLASDREYTTMSSDEYHALFHSIIRQKGWDVMKDFYRVYVKLSTSNQETPANDQKVLLALAVLDHTSGMDLTDTFAKWRIPLDKDKVDQLLATYNIK